MQNMEHEEKNWGDHEEISLLQWLCHEREEGREEEEVRRNLQRKVYGLLSQ